MSICKSKIKHFSLLSAGLLGLLAAPSFANPVHAGFEIMYNRSLGNCVTCHTLGVVDKNNAAHREKQGNFGPDLKGVGSKYSRAQLTQWVVDGRKMNPQTHMPPYGSLEGIMLANQNQTLLSAEQITQVVEALLSLKN